MGGRAIKTRRVLLVDDSQAFLRAAERFLLLCGVPGFELAGKTTTGAQAIEMVDAEHPDLVLMDLAMPGLNGLEAARRIKQRPHAPKVIIVTLRNEPEFRALARDAGADGFLLKEDFVTGLPRLVSALFETAERTGTL